MPPLAHHSWVLQPAAGPPILIEGSEALGGMQISPALLKSPSQILLPLPVLCNPLIPPDWRRGGRGAEHSCHFVASFPWAQAVSRDGGKGRGAVVLIRDWASRAHVIYCKSEKISKPAWKSDGAKALLKPFLVILFTVISLHSYLQLPLAHYCSIIVSPVCLMHQLM